MKKAAILLLAVLFIFPQTVFAEREVVIKNTKTGEVTAMEPKAPEVIFQGDGWVLIDDYEDDNPTQSVKVSRVGDGRSTNPSSVMSLLLSSAA